MEYLMNGKIIKLKFFYFLPSFFLNMNKETLGTLRVFIFDGFYFILYHFKTCKIYIFYLSFNNAHMHEESLCGSNVFTPKLQF